MTELYEELRTLIENSEQSRYRISKDTDIDAGLLSRFMAGTSGLSIETVDKLASYLGYSVTLRKKRRGKRRGSP